MENQSKSSFKYKPKKLHDGEYPDGHDNGDDDDLVHVGESHRDEVSIGSVIVHFYHPTDQRPTELYVVRLFSLFSFPNWEILTFWFVVEPKLLKTWEKYY